MKHDAMVTGKLKSAEEWEKYYQERMFSEKYDRELVSQIIKIIAQSTLHRRSDGKFNSSLDHPLTTCGYSNRSVPLSKSFPAGTCPVESNLHIKSIDEITELSNLAIGTSVLKYGSYQIPVAEIASDIIDLFEEYFELIPKERTYALDWCESVDFDDDVNEYPVWELWDYDVGGGMVVKLFKREKSPFWEPEFYIDGKFEAKKFRLLGKAKEYCVQQYANWRNFQYIQEESFLNPY